MRFDQALARGHQAAQPKQPIEYPKYIDVGNGPVLALNAEHEAELRGPPETGEDDETPSSPSNLLSEPQKRGPGRPRLVRPESA